MNKGDYKKFIEAGEIIGSNYYLSLPEGFSHGSYGHVPGIHTGNSLDFMEYREYQAGDDIRRIDWRVYARSDKLTVKLYREEVNPSIDIIIDGSNSMALEGTMKARATLSISALLGRAALNSEYAVRAWVTEQPCKSISKNSSSSPISWKFIGFKSKINPPLAIKSSEIGFFNKGMRIFVSDLLWQGDPKELLLYLSKNASSVVIIQVLSEQDISPNPIGNSRIIDSENGEQMEILIDSKALKRYQQFFNRHQQSWHKICQAASVNLITITAEELINTWNIESFFKANLIRGQK